MENAEGTTGHGLFGVEEFLRLPDEGGRMELVRGRVVREPLHGARHGDTGLRLLVPLVEHVRARDLGLVTSLETGFLLEEDPPTVRAPDVAFIARARLPAEGVPEGYWRLAPDLAVEVVSPSDTVDAVEEKALDYLRVGVRLVWVLDLRSRTVTIYRSPTDIETVTPDDELSGEDVVEGFRVPVVELFP